MSGYNYSAFNAHDYDLDQFSGPMPGQKAPDVTVETLDGDRIPVASPSARFLVLELGSITCPLFQARRGGMARLVARHPDVTFAVLYVREAHPGALIPAHAAMSDKRAAARTLAEQDGEGRQIWIDDLEGTAHRAFGGYPNAVFIINDRGCVVYRNAWNNPAATGRALRRLKAGRPARVEGAFKPPQPAVALRTLRRAGPGAAADFFHSLPRLIWKNLIKRNLRLLLTRRTGPDPATDC